MPVVVPRHVPAALLHRLVPCAAVGQSRGETVPMLRRHLDQGKGKEPRWSRTAASSVASVHAWMYPGLPGIERLVLHMTLECGGSSLPAERPQIMYLAFWGVLLPTFPLQSRFPSHCTKQSLC